MFGGTVERSLGREFLSRKSPTWSRNIELSRHAIPSLFPRVTPLQAPDWTDDLSDMAGAD